MGGASYDVKDEDFFRTLFSFQDLSLLRYRLHTPDFKGTEADFQGLGSKDKHTRDLDDFMEVMRKF